MNLDFLIDHMKRKLPMSDKVGNAIVAELEKSRDLQEWLKPVVEWFSRSKRDFPGEFKLRDVVLQYEGPRGNVNVTSNQLDAIARLAGEE